MTSVSQNIRGALQLQAAKAPGFPPQGQIAYEGEVFSAAVGIPWARMWLLPQTGRPFDIRAADTAHTGLFQVDVYIPNGLGTAAAEAAADAVCLMFRAGSTFALGGDRIIIDYSERTQAMPQAPDWIYCPVTVGWRCYSASN